MSRRLNVLIIESDSDDEDYLGGRPRWFKERSNYFEDYDDLDFITRFRLSKTSVLNLLTKIEHRLEYASDR